MIFKSFKTKTKAIFLDRDGVINPLIYFKEEGIIDSPFSVRHFKLLPKVGKAIGILKSLGYKTFVISNQPGIAKNKYDIKELERINIKMVGDLKKERAFIDGIYYCLHHPEALNLKYKMKCKCRKPKPGLILQAAKEHGIDLHESYMIGDNISDIKAGKAANCKTIFIGSLKCDYCKLLQENDVFPDFIVKDLFEAAKLIENEK